MWLCLCSIHFRRTYGNHAGTFTPTIFLSILTRCKCSIKWKFLPFDILWKIIIDFRNIRNASDIHKTDGRSIHRTISSNLIQNNKHILNGSLNRNTSWSITAREPYEYQFLCVRTHTCFAVTTVFTQVPAVSHPSMLRPSQDWQAPWQPLRSGVMGKGCFYLLMRSVPRAPVSLSQSAPLSALRGEQGAAAIWKNRLDTNAIRPRDGEIGAEGGLVPRTENKSCRNCSQSPDGSSCCV